VTAGRANQGNLSVGPIRATRAVVDLDAIAANVRALRMALPATTRLMAVVKADGYGHGAPWVAEAALGAGAEVLGVATVSEGAILRGHGIDAPIVLLGSMEPCEADSASRLRLEITVADERLLLAVQDAARLPAVATPIAVHVKVDTGLRRYGAVQDLALALAQGIAQDPLLRFAGLCTHFASADEIDEPFTGWQWEQFRRVAESIEDSGILLPPRHVANSAAILTGRCGDCEMARAGIAIYGVPPSGDVSLLPSMRPAMRVESRIARIVPIAAGETVGYNRTFRADRPMRGALVPIGYADGYRRSLAGRAWMGIAGHHAKVLGRVSMDQCVVEIPEGVDAKPGDVVHVFGDSESGAPSLAEMAWLMDTNTYEVLVGVRQRLPRIFVKEGTVIATRSIDDEYSRWNERSFTG
jgi:alanine racemase